jgi:arginyl-tRNA synthetase
VGFSEYNNAMITDKITENILYSLQQVYCLNLTSGDVEISKADSAEHGDFSTNIAFRLSKELKKNPKEIAEKLAENLDANGGFKKVIAVNGYINLFLDHEYFQGIVKNILDKKDKYADLELLKGQKIQVEFISANPTGPLTLANGRGGFAGDVLANVFAKAGATVEREYYVNDGGNQVRVLGKSLLLLSTGESSEEEVYKGDYLCDILGAYEDDSKFQKMMSSKDVEEMGRIAAKDILEKLIKPSVKKMNIHFDNWFSERDLIERGEVNEAISRLKELGYIKEEEGALWMKTTEFGDDKDRVLVKADGEKTYFANDVAYHYDKLYKRKFTKVVNFWGADHHGYIARLQAAVSAMGYPGTLKVVIMQLVRLIKGGEEFKMSKRKGTYVTMDDLLELIGGSARDASDVARFFFLMRSFNTHMDFDLDLAAERSEKNPVFYVKYAYARLSGILRNAGELKLPKANLALLTDSHEIELIDQLSQLEQVIMSVIAFDDYPVHYLTYYAIETAKKFHAFYDKCRVIDEDNLELTSARIELVRATKVVLGIVMRDLIGIDAPERM